MSLCLIDDKSYQFVYALHQIGTRIGGTGLGDVGNAVTLCTRHQRRHAALLTKLRSKVEYSARGMMYQFLPY